MGFQYRLVRFLSFGFKVTLRIDCLGANEPPQALWIACHCYIPVGMFVRAQSTYGFDTGADACRLLVLVLPTITANLVWSSGTAQPSSY